MEAGDCIVIDAGSASVKAGYSGEDTPRSVFPSILDAPDGSGGGDLAGPAGSGPGGLPRSGGRRPESVECHFENAALHPIQHGVVAEGNWEKMERLWDVTFGRELHQYPEGSSASGKALAALLSGLLTVAAAEGVFINWRDPCVVRFVWRLRRKQDSSYRNTAKNIFLQELLC